MKSTFLIGSVFLIGSLLTSCGQAPSGEQAATGEAMDATAATGQAYTVDVANSIINWEGTKLIGSDKHTGTLKLQKGEILVANGNITGGEFVLDMNSIANTDQQPGEGKEDLEAHLKDGDFFEVGKFPTAVFTIIKAEPVSGNPEATHNISGNFTMKGITKSIVIPAKVSFTESGISAMTPRFTIDRTQWNVMFHAGVLGTAKDEIINDLLGLQIQLVAKS